MLLSDVCLSVAYIGPNSRTERPRKTKISTEVAHVTGDSDTTFKVKGQGHQADLLSATLTRKAAAAVSVGTYSAWESTVTLRLLGGARGAWAHTGRRGAGHIVSPRAQLVISMLWAEQQYFWQPKTGFWPSYCQISTNLDTILHTPIIVRNTLVGRLDRRVSGSRPNQNVYVFCNTCNAP